MMEKCFLKIQPGKPENLWIRVPGSKSESHRYLIATALAKGPSIIENLLLSEDILFTIHGLRNLGIRVEEVFHGTFRVWGRGGEIPGASCDIFLGNSGTSMRLLAALAALGKEGSILDGTSRMRKRPISELLHALNQIHVSAESVLDSGCPPVLVGGGASSGGRISLFCNVSSQYLSGLLLIAPCLEQGLEISVDGEPVSKPYIDMTLHVMEKMGISHSRKGYEFFKVSGGQAYIPGNYHVAADASSASYFFAAAAVTGGSLGVEGLFRDSVQGDLGFLSILEKMGCMVSYREKGVFICGGDLKGVDVDMRDMPDMVPGLAVVAAFAQGKSRLRNLSHLKVKESDRLQAVFNELQRMGAVVEILGDDLLIEGGKTLHGAHIRTYDDHRMAMAFSVAGLLVQDVFIENPGCVAKSFPDFFDAFSSVMGAL